MSDLLLQLAIPLFFLALIVIPVLIARPVRSAPVIVRLRNRFLVVESEPVPAGHWTRIWLVKVTSEKETLNLRDWLLLACSPSGLHMKIQGPSLPVVDLPPITIPWQFVEYESTSKFGFFKATLRISGFDDGPPVTIQIDNTTDLAVGQFLKQLASIAPNSKAKE